MYEAHFRLQRKPFAETLNPAAYLPLASRDNALHRLRYGIEHGQGPALLAGTPGAGKSIMARALAESLDSHTIHLTFPCMPAESLLLFLAHELGASHSPAAGIAGLVRTLTTHLGETSRTGRRPLLIVDEAHLITDPTVFETLRLLLNFASAGPPDLDLLLVGNTELLDLVPPALADRLVARCVIGQLSASESAQYILGRMQDASASDDTPGNHEKSATVFHPETLAALHAASDGLPRRLNRLADLCLLISYARGQTHPDVETVILAAEEAGYDLLAA